MRKIISLIIGLLIFSMGQGQQLLTGKVLDADTNEPIEGAIITNVENQLNIFTDENGEFQFYESPELIEVYSDGYEAILTNLTEENPIIYLYPVFEQLDEVIITANREAQKRNEVPAAIEVISSKEIENTKATRLDMLLNKAPGVFMVDLGNEQHSMSIRQPMGTNSLFLYLEDGIPIRTVGDFNHNALIEINQASMERIEVVRGPASSLYGSEAVGGAVNFITKSPSEFLKGKIQAEAGTRGYKRTDFEVSNTYGKAGIYLGGYYANQNRKNTEHNDFDKLALTLRGNYQLNDKSKIVAVADLIRYDTDQIGGLDSLHFYDKNYESLYRFTYRKVDALRLRTTLNQAWNSKSNTEFTLFYRYSSVKQNPFYNIVDDLSNPLKAKGEENDDRFNSFGGLIQHSQSFDKLNSKLITGVSYSYNPTEYSANLIHVNRNESGVYYDYSPTDSLLTDYKVNLMNSAIYGQWEYRPIKKLRLLAGVRYDRLDYHFTNHLPPSAFSGAPDANNHFSRFTPKLGLTYNFNQKRGIYANYSQGFAPPNITDLYRGVKVPVLKPSSYDNYEFGGWFTFDKSKALLEVSFYRLNGKDELVSTRLTDGSRIYQNAGKTSHTGIEWNFKYRPFSELDIRIGGTAARHKFEDFMEDNKDFSGNKMPQSPSYLLNSELTYYPSQLKNFRIGVEMQNSGSYYTDRENTSKYGGFTVFNLRAGYKIQNWEIWMNWINVFNRNYAVMVDKNAWGTTYRPGELSTLSFGAAWHFGK